MTRKSAQLVLAVLFSLGIGVLPSKAANIMKYQPVEQGKLQGIETQVPVVIMQVIGKGEKEGRRVGSTCRVEAHRAKPEAWRRPGSCAQS